MKKLIAALALTAAAATAPAFAGNVGFSISVGEPGFYGQIDIGGYGRPSLIYSEPVVLAPRYRSYAPVYIRAPIDHYRHWDRYCGRYDACFRPAYFVRDEWYNQVYVPRYRQYYAPRNWRDDHRDWRDDRRDWRGNRRDWRDDRRDWRGDRRDDRHDWRDDRKDWGGDRRDERREDRRDGRRDPHQDDRDGWREHR